MHKTRPSAFMNCIHAFLHFAKVVRPPHRYNSPEETDRRTIIIDLTNGQMSVIIIKRGRLVASKNKTINLLTNAAGPEAMHCSK